jgi:hypothetical protein
MGLGTGLSGTEFTFLSGLGATSGAAHRQGLLLGDFHNHIMHAYLTTRWSILTGPGRMAIVRWSSPEMSSRKTKAHNCMRNSPKSRGDAPASGGQYLWSSIWLPSVVSVEQVECETANSCFRFSSLLKITGIAIFAARNSFHESTKHYRPSDWFAARPRRAIRRKNESLLIL